LSDRFPIQNGLKQGDALSPLLFKFAVLSVCTEEEQHSMIWFLWPESVSGAAIYQKLSAQYRKRILLQGSVYE
jgi:hypothetical protein